MIVYNVNFLVESEVDKMILIKDMVYCFLFVGIFFDNFFECGLYERYIRICFDNCV